MGTKGTQRKSPARKTKETVQPPPTSWWNSDVAKAVIAAVATILAATLPIVVKSIVDRPAVTPSPSPSQTSQSAPVDLAATSISNGSCPPDMILIPKGPYIMGATEEDAMAKERTGETPSHTINLSEYCIDRTEVSNRSFAEFIKVKKKTWAYSAAESDYELPVVMVTWEEAKDYCEWKGETTGFTIKLPNEFQWEKAARGPNGKIYPWGNIWSPELANAEQKQEKFTLLPVDSFALGASDYGVLNMAGNAAEWVEDWYQEKRYSNILDGQTDPKAEHLPNGAEKKIVRGGAANSSRIDVRTTVRLGAYGPYDQRQNIGFRCATDYMP